MLSFYKKIMLSYKCHRSGNPECDRTSCSIVVFHIQSPLKKLEQRNSTKIIRVIFFEKCMKSA